MAYVSTDGNYGGDDEVLVFDYSELTVAQWENLGQITDSERHDYAFAILNNDEEAIRELEEAYELEPTL